MLHQLHAALVGGDGGFEFELAAFHAGDDVLEFGKRRLKFHGGDGHWVHVSGVRGNTRKYSIQGLQVKCGAGKNLVFSTRWSVECLTWRICPVWPPQCRICLWTGTSINRFMSWRKSSFSMPVRVTSATS